jgi:tetratricopeptide (TPR) repeat protein
LVNRSDDSLAEARAWCARTPRAPEPWVALARGLLDARRAAEAVAAVERALALDPQHAAALAIRKAAVDALKAGDPALTVLELTAAAAPEDAAAQLGLGQAYAEIDRPADAERCFKQALALAPGLVAAQASLAALYLGVGMAEAAEHYSRLALAAEPGQAVASQTLAAVLEARGDGEAAERLLDAAYARQALFVEPAREARFTVLVLATRSSGNIPYRHIMPPGRHARLIWYMEHARVAEIAAAPAYDVVFNTIGDPDLAAPSAAAVRAFLAGCARPALNDPDKVARTRRDLIPGLLGDLAGVVVPAAVRLDAGRLNAGGVGEAGLAPPLLVRPTGSHGGEGLALAETAEALEALGPAFAGRAAYATRFLDYRSTDGRYRKGRMIFVDRRPYPYHWAIADRWLVHYESAGMGGDAVRQAEERRFLEDPQSALGPLAFAAIGEIGRRLDLDYCGLDFSLLPDGQVLVFEANATMYVHPEPQDGELAYKNPAVRRITDAFQAHLAVAAASGR